MKIGDFSQHRGGSFLLANGAQKAQAQHAEGIRDRDVHMRFFHWENVPVLSPLVWGEADEDLGAGEMHLQQEPAIQLSSIQWLLAAANHRFPLPLLVSK